MRFNESNKNQRWSAAPPTTNERVHSPPDKNRRRKGTKNWKAVGWGGALSIKAQLKLTFTIQTLPIFLHF